MIVQGLLSLFLYFICAIVVFVLVLSLTGTSTGIRETCAILILTLFEVAARHEAKDAILGAAHEPIEEISEDEDERTYVKDKHTVESLNALPRRRPTIFRQNSSGELAIIDRRWSSSLDRKLNSRSPSCEPLYKETANDNFNIKRGIDPEFETLKVIIEDTGLFISAGIEAIIEDEVTSRFKAAQLPSWNFLSRSRAAYKVSWKLGVIWFFGFLVRYFFFFPIRFILFLLSGSLLIVIPTLVGCVPNQKLREELNHYAMLMCMRVSARAFSAIVTFHNKENRPSHGICVANHTSPIDVMILSCDNCYGMIGQRQGGFLGLLQRSLSRSAHHIWFERSEAKDRKQVTHRLREHVEDPSKLPILIFPEGTCINNTSVMLFKKGSFEVSTKIYPIAIKYDNRLGDAFWNSHEQGYLTYLLSMMTAWAMVCDVWYLPPVTRKEDEDSVAFARRVQRLIAKKGGLIDLEWDGNLKRAQVSDRLKAEKKDLFYRYLTRNTALCECGKSKSAVSIAGMASNNDLNTSGDNLLVNKNKSFTQNIKEKDLDDIRLKNTKEEDDDDDMLRMRDLLSSKA